MTDTANRRPLRVRELRLMNRFAAWLSSRDITPNKISIFSVVCALGGALALLLAGQATGAERAGWFIATALMIQLRLMCNLFDGMVAVEGGKQTPAGELFNDVPDRLADPLLIVACAFALPEFPSATWLAWLAALLAVLTAYIRVLGVAVGVPADFRGPMAKQQRMALLTLACLLCAAEAYWNAPGTSLWIALMIMVGGTAATCVRRLATAYRLLENRGN